MLYHHQQKKIIERYVVVFFCQSSYDDNQGGYSHSSIGERHIEFEIFDKIEEKKFLVLIIKTKQNKTKLFTLNKNYQ